MKIVLRIQITGEMWSKIGSRLPCSDSQEDKARRDEIFNGMDMNANGYLSLAEVDKGLRDVLKVDQIFDCKPVILRAFNASKAISQAA